jgi:pimeloyl-ACP methyl ester carboxylesterase
VFHASSVYAKAALIRDICNQELAVRQFLLTNLVRSEDRTHLTWRVPIDILSSSLDDMADFPFRDPDEVRYNKPTLFIRGTKSHYVADEALPIIGRFFPRFEVVDIEAGHWVISENPEAFRRGKLFMLPFIHKCLLVLE